MHRRPSCRQRFEKSRRTTWSLHQILDQSPTNRLAGVWQHGLRHDDAISHQNVSIKTNMSEASTLLLSSVRPIVVLITPKGSSARGCALKLEAGIIKLHYSQEILCSFFFCCSYSMCVMSIMRRGDFKIFHREEKLTCVMKRIMSFMLLSATWISIFEISLHMYIIF